MLGFIGSFILNRIVTKKYAQAPINHRSFYFETYIPNVFFHFSTFPCKLF